MMCVCERVEFETPHLQINSGTKIGVRQDEGWLVDAGTTTYLFIAPLSALQGPEILVISDLISFGVLSFSKFVLKELLRRHGARFIYFSMGAMGAKTETLGKFIAPSSFTTCPSNFQAKGPNLCPWPRKRTVLVSTAPWMCSLGDSVLTLERRCGEGEIVLFPSHCGLATFNSIT